MQTSTSRIDMKIDAETKLLAERAAAASGQSLSAYLYRLIRQDAPVVLEQQQRIRLSSQDYDQFIQACEHPEHWPASEKLRAAAKKLDEEGFKWR